MTNTNIRANRLDFKFISWKSYNSIKKKAMEQEFSWPGLLISLSIAFFIVITCAIALNLVQQSIISAQVRKQQLNNQLYRLENIKSGSPDITDHLHKRHIDNNKIKYFSRLNLASAKTAEIKEFAHNYFI